MADAALAAVGAGAIEIHGKVSARNQDNVRLSLFYSVKAAVVFLAIALRVLPICRAVLLSEFTVVPPIQAVCRLLAVAAVLLGSYDAVSGASSGISGVVKYSGSTPVGNPTNYVVEPVEQPFRYP